MKSLGDCPCSTKRTQAAAGRLVGFIDPEYRILDVIDPNEHIKKFVRESSSSGDFHYQALQAKIALPQDLALIVQTVKPMRSEESK